MTWDGTMTDSHHQDKKPMTKFVQFSPQLRRLKMKKIEYFNEQLDKSDKEYISDMIDHYLRDRMDVMPISFDYEIHVTYEEDEE